jgi:Na+-transporting methylmalonyl-CoA/oxaloacetate decarboxylase gamma subunit
MCQSHTADIVAGVTVGFIFTLIIIRVMCGISEACRGEAIGGLNYKVVIIVKEHN